MVCRMRYMVGAASCFFPTYHTYPPPAVRFTAFPLPATYHIPFSSQTVSRMEFHRFR